jgi:DNA-binding CsgD family transcriptional regulator
MSPARGPVRAAHGHKTESRVFACGHRLGRHYWTILLAQGKYVNLRMKKKAADEMRLSHEDLAALLQAILELNECCDRRSFRRVLPGVFLELVRGDHFRFREYHLDFAGRAVRLVDWVESGRPKMRQGAARSEQWAFDYSVSRCFMEQHSRTALERGDPLDLTGLPCSRVGRAGGCCADPTPRISLPMVCGKQTAAVICIGKQANGFGDRDRLVLELIKPHCSLVCRKLEPSAVTTGWRSRPLSISGLTRREGEVANWLEQGKTNPEIAVIPQASVRTVEKHMERILAKLGVENRTAAAAALVAARSRPKPNFRLSPSTGPRKPSRSAGRGP